jgi:hypothetical protein
VDRTSGQAPLRDSATAFGHVLETDFVGAGEAGPNGEDPVGNCPSPGDAPPERLRHTGGGPFTSGDLIVVDAIERLPASAPTARVRVLGLGSPSPVGIVTALRGQTVRIRVCGAPGMALLRLT